MEIDYALYGIVGGVCLDFVKLVAHARGCKVCSSKLEQIFLDVQKCMKEGP